MTIIRIQAILKLFLWIVKQRPSIFGKRAFLCLHLNLKLPYILLYNSFIVHFLQFTLFDKLETVACALIN